jgi:hypothetical protein
VSGVGVNLHFNSLDIDSKNDTIYRIHYGMGVMEERKRLPVVFPRIALAGDRVRIFGFERRGKMKSNIVFLFGTIISCGISAIAAVRNVPSQYSTIQTAINASVNGDTVAIAPGVYKGNGNRDIYFYGKAITVRGVTDNPSDCVIDSNGTGTDQHRGFNFTYGEGSNSILEAITVRGGYGYGGGIYIDSSSPVINNCIIRNNSAPQGCGGGIFTSSGSPKINRCIIRDNTGGWGAGIFNQGGSAITSNCTILNNVGAGGCGSAIYNFVNSNSITRNCTISGNVMQGESIICNAYNESGRPSMTNCITWGNTAAALIHGFITVTYCDMQYGYTGAGNINRNPLFSTGGYRLTASSPCINYGNPTYQAMPGETDLDGNLRVLYGRIDIGAYEFVASASGDIDADGDIDYNDFMLFKNAFASWTGNSNYTLRADLDADGRVTFVDYQQWLALYNAANPLYSMSMNATELSVPGDLDGDLDVDASDFAVLAAGADSNSMSTFADLQLITEHWLECWRFDCPQSSEESGM